jgi:hypothetical protein
MAIAAGDSVDEIRGRFASGAGKQHPPAPIIITNACGRAFLTLYSAL